MATSPLFGWQEPDDTSLVKDGAAAIRTLGNAIDTSMGDLLGGTTGQVLAKASNTNMDFTWVAQDDSNAIQNAIVDAKGDLIAATANDTPARLAVGNNGETLVADSSTSTGLRYNPQNALANPVINGGFDIWQRGTSSAVANSSYNYYGTDRWQTYRGSTGGTISRQVTGDTTNLPNVQYCMRVQRDSGTTSTSFFQSVNNFESVNSIPFAGRTVTFSFYARAGANYSATSNLLVGFILTGTGTDQNANFGFTGSSSTAVNATLTTTWQRFTGTVTLAANATQIGVGFVFTPTGTAGANDYYEVTGVQVDLGTYTASTAPAFRRAGGTIQGELQACQRYYFRMGGLTGFTMLGQGVASATTRANCQVMLPVTMRVVPTSLDFSTLCLQQYDGQPLNAATAVILTALTGVNLLGIQVDVASGLTTGSVFRFMTNSSTSGFLGISAEL